MIFTSIILLTVLLLGYEILGFFLVFHTWFPGKNFSLMSKEDIKLIKKRSKFFFPLSYKQIAKNIDAYCQGIDERQDNPDIFQ